MSGRIADFVHRLASTSPELVDIYRQHIADHGELLPHVLMGDITRVVVTASASANAGRGKLETEARSRLPSGRKPDSSRNGRPIELKPNTPSGVKKGQQQLKKYEKETGNKGKLICYDTGSSNLKIVKCGS
jgi:hypothetical protein